MILYRTVASTALIGLLGAVGLGWRASIHWVGMQNAIAGNAEAIEEKPTVEQVQEVRGQIKNTQQNQVELLKGISRIGRNVDKIAEKLEVETERPPQVTIRVDGDGGD
jgi:hypothetical protein